MALAPIQSHSTKDVASLFPPRRGVKSSPRPPFSSKVIGVAAGFAVAVTVGNGENRWLNRASNERDSSFCVSQTPGSYRSPSTNNRHVSFSAFIAPTAFLASVEYFRK